MQYIIMKNRFQQA